MILLCAALPRCPPALPVDHALDREALWDAEIPLGFPKRDQCCCLVSIRDSEQLLHLSIVQLVQRR